MILQVPAGTFQEVDVFSFLFEPLGSGLIHSLRGYIMFLRYISLKTIVGWNPAFLSQAGDVFMKPTHKLGTFEHSQKPEVFNKMQPTWMSQEIRITGL